MFENDVKGLYVGVSYLQLTNLSFQGCIRKYGGRQLPIAYF